MATRVLVVEDDRDVRAMLKMLLEDGFELCRLVRQASDVPIVIVTAQIDDVDMMAGLEAGADDYVTKPFTAKVLTARLRALLRRAQGAADHTGRLVFGDVEVSPREGEVRKGGRRGPSHQDGVPRPL